MKAILVKYLPATDYRGTRMKAVAEGAKPFITGYDHSLNPEQNATRSAYILMVQEGWNNHAAINGVGSMPPSKNGRSDTWAITLKAR